MFTQPPGSNKSLVRIPAGRAQCYTVLGQQQKDLSLSNLKVGQIQVHDITVCGRLTGGDILIGPPGIQGQIGEGGLFFIGPEGIEGKIGPEGIEGKIGPEGLSITGPQGLVGSIGPQGIEGKIGPAGLSITGPQGLIGSIGPQGIEGKIGPQGLSIIGPQGLEGSIGPQGIEGKIGPQGLSGVIGSGEFVRMGSQPAPVNPGQPFTFDTTVVSSSTIVPMTGLFAPPFTQSGTVFRLGSVGRYEINFQATYGNDRGMILYRGATVATMTPLAYSVVGKSSTGGQTFGSVLLETQTANSFVSVNAAAGNTSSIQTSANSSANNAGVSSVSIKHINSAASG